MDDESQFSTKVTDPCDSLPQAHVLTHGQLHAQNVDSQPLTHGQLSPHALLSLSLSLP